MAQLPKSLISKYGISKKAWAVYRSSRSSTNRTRSTSKMARKGRKSYGRSKSSNMSLTELLGGVAAYAVARPFVAGMVPDGFLGLPAGYSDNIVLGGAGVGAAWKGSGMIKKAGTVVAVTETFIGVSKLASSFTAGSTSSDGGYL